MSIGILEPISLASIYAASLFIFCVDTFDAALASTPGNAVVFTIGRGCSDDGCPGTSGSTIGAGVPLVSSSDIIYFLCVLTEFALLLRMRMLSDDDDFLCSGFSLYSSARSKACTNKQIKP